LEPMLAPELHSFILEKKKKKYFLILALLTAPPRD
jgi:hypothetical protein